MAVTHPKGTLNSCNATELILPLEIYLTHWTLEHLAKVTWHGWVDPELNNHPNKKTPAEETYLTRMILLEGQGCQLMRLG